MRDNNLFWGYCYDYLQHKASHERMVGKMTFGIDKNMDKEKLADMIIEKHNLQITKASKEYTRGYRVCMKYVIQVLKGGYTKEMMILLLENSLKLQELMEKEENGIEGTKGNSSPPTS
jgi:hypothetical protein